MKIGRLRVESELIPYAAGFPPGSRWLVLAPHPDDEAFGIGATLALGVRRGVEAHVVVVTDGGAQGDASEREIEASAAADALGLPEPEFWRFPDRSLRPDDPALRTRIERALEQHAPDVLFVTSPVEFHPDHRALGNGRVTGQCRLERSGGQPVPGHVQHVVGATHHGRSPRAAWCGSYRAGASAGGQSRGSPRTRWPRRCAPTSWWPPTRHGSARGERVGATRGRSRSGRTTSSRRPSGRCAL